MFNRRLRRRARAGLSVAAGLVALGCSACSLQADSKLADDATTTFFKQLAAGQFDQVYAGAAPEMQNAMAQVTFVGMMQRIHRRMGDCAPASKAGAWHVSETPSGFFRTQDYQQKCANGVLNESVTMAVRSGAAKLAGYYASSPLLLTD